ncbi:hypothetical protein [Bacillus sp. CECT 9360]|uniref:hypothetical protein n=1 Tax=Bacillus sp. CECT 9360 TaxID=2845821 RepID=UPI001E5F5982|nr:hypothetical protein [Bacillus sp. CECT 9360]CAH0345752.1 hypothetical protein BCI9360_02050 [Bacillus sp. CECT 9360]
MNNSEEKNEQNVTDELISAVVKHVRAHNDVIIFEDGGVLRYYTKEEVESHNQLLASGTITLTNKNYDTE